MKLVPVSAKSKHHCEILYSLLGKRPDVARVSSRGGMPTFEEHCDFVKNHPYADWCLIDPFVGHVDNLSGEPVFVGSVFLSQPARPSVVGDELSVDIFKEYEGRGYARSALEMMMARHGPRRYVANIATTNYASMALFQKLGFTQCQVTFELDETKDQQ